MRLKRILCLCMSIFLLIGIMPCPVANASGYTLEQLQAKFPNGKYWNHQAKSGHGYNGIAHYGSNCGDIENSVTSTPCSNHYGTAGVGGYDCNTYRNLGMQCNGFARKLANLVYGVNDCVSSWSTVTNKSSAISQVKPGDVIHYKGYDADSTYGHWVFVIAVSGSTVTLGECNYGGNCLIKWGRQLNLNNVSSLILYKAPYAMNKSSTSYTSIATGTYYIKNVATGTWLSVSEGKDVNMNAVNLWTNTGDAMKMVIMNAPTGYKIRPYVCKSRLVNPNAVYVSHGNNINIYDDVNDSSQWWQFEKVGDYYVIHNVQNPSCVLDAPNGKTSIAYARTYTGANSQKWVLECVSHSYDGGKVTVNATCESTGTKVYTCKVCGATKTETIGKTSHNYNATVIQPTCTKTGYTKYTCTICGASYNANETSATGHSYNTTVIAPTCTESGYTKFTCSVCGDSYTSEKTTGYGHDYVETRKEATCQEQGYIKLDCLRCDDDHITLFDKKDHSWDNGTVTKAASATETGIYTYTCVNCGEKKNEEISKLSSMMGDTNKDGKITASDARLTLRAAAGLQSLTAEQLSLSDMDANGRISASDARKILRISAGLDKPAQGTTTPDFSRHCGSYYSGNIENGPCYVFELLSVDKNTNTATIHIYYVGKNLSPVYDVEQITTKLSADGSASFNWKDSWGNEGTGTFKIKTGTTNSIDLTMVITKEAASNRATLATNGVLNLSPMPV